jgi:aminopeptidase
MGRTVPITVEEMPGPMKPAELERYADMVVRGCIAFRRGDELLIRPSLAHRDLAVALTEAAYRAGAAAVDVEYEDNRVYAARIRYASRDGLGARTSWQRERMRALGREQVAIVQVMGEHEQGVLASLPPERVAESTKRLQAGTGLGRIRREARLRGTICAWPTEDWAARVFPGLDPARAMRRLARDLLWFCRLGPDDPAGFRGWTEHLATLRRRATRLTKLDLKELHVRDSGTDLRLRIAPLSMWRGGGEEDMWGRRIAMNVPTEECFISPDAAATEGVFSCSRPRSFSGRVIEGLSGEFRGGRLVRLSARRNADRDWLARYLAAIPNADRLGEIALVDSSSRIGQTGRIYYNGLLDENAAAHMAFGSGFAKTRTVPIGRARHGVNRSNTHIDVMIGTDALEAVGVRQNGRSVVLVADGTWRI